MQRQSDILEIPRGGPRAAIRLFIIAHASRLWITFYAGYQAFRHGFREYILLDCLLVFACIYMLLHLVRQVRIFVAAFNTDTPYLTIDSTGLAVSLPQRQSWPWWDVVACACKNEKGRRVLQVFLSGRAKIKIDIDFALAAEPKRSLDEAMVACAAWIVATRDPSETETPIHEFRDEHAASRKVLYTIGAICVVALVVLGVLRSL